MRKIHVGIWHTLWGLGGYFTACRPAERAGDRLIVRHKEDLDKVTCLLCRRKYGLDDFSVPNPGHPDDPASDNYDGDEVDDADIPNR